MVFGGLTLIPKGEKYRICVTSPLARHNVRHGDWCGMRYAARSSVAGVMAGQETMENLASGQRLGWVSRS